jgi:type IV secretory pathway VirB4 component
MMNLAEYRRRSQSLADFLPWAALVRKGVVLNKDGSFQRTAKFRGPDLDSSTPAELVAITSRLNNALRRLGTGWAIFIEAQRQPAHSYPLSDFPEPTSRLLGSTAGRPCSSSTRVGSRSTTPASPGSSGNG